MEREEPGDGKIVSMPIPAIPTVAEGPEVAIGVGVDRASNKVVLDVGVTGAGQPPIKLRLYFDANETAQLCKSLVSAGMEIERGVKAEGPKLFHLPRRLGPTPKK